MIRWLAFLAALALCLPASAAAAESALPPPVPPPKGPAPVPEGERQFMLWEDVAPGVRIWCQNLHGDLWHFGTTQSVGDGAGITRGLMQASVSGVVAARDILERQGAGCREK